VHLDRVFRQAEGSASSPTPTASTKASSRSCATSTIFFFFPKPQPEQCGELVVDLGCERILGASAAIHAARSRSVADAPWASRCASAEQAAAGGAQPAASIQAERLWSDTIFRLNDRVLQVRNNYDLDVYNGDVGEIVAIDRDAQKLTVRFEEARGAREVTYDWAFLDECSWRMRSAFTNRRAASIPWWSCRC
jgi:exodeoxyribonuclease V alpha subunit